MRSVSAVGRLMLMFGLIAALGIDAEAQRGGGRGERGGGGGAGMLRFMLPVEQTLGFLAFDENIELADDQLLKIRGNLKAVHRKRAELAKEMQGGAGDRQAMMEKFRELRGEMFEGIKEVLDDRQDKLLDEYLERLQERFQRRGGGGRGGVQGGGTE